MYTRSYIRIQRIARSPNDNRIFKDWKSTLDYIKTTNKLIGNVVNRTIVAFESTWNLFLETEISKKVKETEGYKIAMEIAKAGMAAGFNIVGGVVEGLKLIKNSGVKATVDIVEHKYGKTAGKAIEESLKIVENATEAFQFTHTRGLVVISVAEAAKIKEEKEKVREREKDLSNSFE